MRKSLNSFVPANVSEGEDVNKAQLVEAIADKLGGRQQAADAVDAVLDAMVRAVVAGDRVSVTGFGSFDTFAIGATPMFGTTPLKDLSLYEGTHRVRLLNPDRRLEKNVTLVVRAGRPNRFRFKL